MCHLYDDAGAGPRRAPWGMPSKCPHMKVTSPQIAVRVKYASYEHLLTSKMLRVKRSNKLTKCLIV